MCIHCGCDINDHFRLLRLDLRIFDKVHKSPLLRSIQEGSQVHDNLVARDMHTLREDLEEGAQAPQQGLVLELRPQERRSAEVHNSIQPELELKRPGP